MKPALDLPSLIFHGAEAAWRRRYLIVVPMLALPPAAFVAGGFAPKVYEARTSILVQETAKLNPFLNDLAVGPNLKERMPALNTLAHSSHVLEGVLRDTGDIDDKTDEAEKVRRINALSGAISVELMGGDLVSFRIRGASGQGMAKTLNALSKRFVDRLLAPERSSIEDSQTFLEQEMAERSRRLSDAQTAAAKFKDDNRERLPVLEGGLVSRLSALQQRLSDNRMALKAAEAELGDVRQRLIGTNPVIGKIEEDILKSRRKLGELRTRYTDDHTAVLGELRTLKRLEDERESLVKSAESMEGADIDRLWNIAAGQTMRADEQAPPLLVSQMTRLQESNSAYLKLKEETAAIETEIGNLQKAIAETGPVMQEQKRLDEAIRLAQDSYDAIAKRFDNAQITRSLGEFEAPERIKVIDKPQDPVSPVSPGRILYLLAGLLGGIFAGAGLAVAAEVLDTRLRSVRQFEDATGVAVAARFNSAA